MGAPGEVPASREGTPRQTRHVICALGAGVAVVLVSAGVWLGGSYTINTRRNEQWKVVMRDLRTLATAVELHGVDQNEYPRHAAGSIEQVMPALQPLVPATPLPVRDPWDRPYVMLVFKNAKGYLLASAGQDGRWEQEVGGPFLRDDPGRDVVFIDGAFFQYPEAIQCDCSDDELARLVAQEQGSVRARWLSPDMAEVRSQWETLPRQ